MVNVIISTDVGLCYGSVLALNVGGNWNNTSNAGLSYVNANNNWTNTNTNIGARLAVPLWKILITFTMTMPLGKRQIFRIFGK